MRLRWALPLVLCSLLPGLAAAQGGKLAACDARVGKDSGDWGAVRCYLRAARSGPGAKDSVARHLLQRIARDPRDSHSRFALAHVRASQGLDDAVALFTDAATEYAKASDPTGEVLARAGLANYLGRRGRLPDALASIAIARSAAEGSLDPRLVAWVNTEDAWLAYHQLDYGRALRLLDAVTETVDATPDADLRSAWLSARGATFWAIGRADEARQQYELQAAHLAQVGNKYEEATARSNIVLLTGGPARRTLAFEVARLARESGNLAIESSAYFYLSGASPPAEAISHARRSLELALAARQPGMISRAKSALATFTLDIDPQEAFRLIDEAILDARGLGDPNQAVRIRFTKAMMRWRVGSRAEAMAASASLIDAIEALRAFQPEDDLRAQRFGQWRFAYYRLAGHLLAGHHAPSGVASDEEQELAFRTMERMRARSLLDRLDVAGASRPPSDGALRSSRAAVLTKISAANRQLSLAGDGPAGRDGVLKTLQGLEREAADLGARIARADPAFGDLHRPALASLTELRRALGPDEALIAFQAASVSQADSGPYGGWVWTLTRERASVVPLRDTENLRSAVDVFLGLIQRRDGSEPAAAARLYADYLAPALASLPAGVSRLVIVPDESLHRVPFDALRETADGPPIAVKYEIAIAPSASMWLRWRRQAVTPARIPALVLADPSLPGYTGGAADERSVASGLMPLPEARREGAAVARAVGRRSEIYSGGDATEQRVKRARLSDYRVLHFAAHAVTDDRNPERTAILLAPGADGTDDGLLQVREIVDLPLSGQVVLLSGCRTIGGAVVSGEGPLGLAHAFFRAGARTVVATLWTVRDVDAAQAFTLVADGLGRGESVTGAVALARRELAARGVPAAAWAGLVVMGDGALVPFPGGRDRQPAWWMMASAACAIFAGAAWTIRRRRNRSVRAGQPVAQAAETIGSGQAL